MDPPQFVFEEMRKEQQLCDALLNVAGVQFPAHKLVLSSCSTYFRSLFTQWSSPDCHDFPISKVSADIMKIILVYCYTGVAYITQENVQVLFIAADYLDVSGITQACCQIMEEQLCPSNCIAIWGITNKYYYPQLKKQAFLYILKHFEEVASSEEFLHLSGEDLCSLIDEDQLNVKKELTVFEVVLRWVAHAPLERNKHMANLLPKVHLALINPHYFTQCMCNHDQLQNHNFKTMFMKTIKLMLDARARGSDTSMYSTRLARPRLPWALLMAIGGWSGELLNNIEVYDNRAKLWVDVTTNEGLARVCHGTVFLDGSVYLIGGSDDNQQLKTTHKFDLVNFKWEKVVPMHFQRCHVSVALLDGLIYAMGGLSEESCLETVERYSPETNQWTIIPPVNEQRSDTSSTAFGGGYDGEHCLFTAESYNPLTDQWSMIAPMISMRHKAGVIAYANEIYAVGGFSLSSHMNAAEAYNPSTNMWRPLQNMLTRRSNFGIGVVDDQLYVVGGFDGSSIMNSVERFDVRTGAWSRVRDMVIPRTALSCCVVYDLPNMADYAAPRDAPAHDDSPEEQTFTRLNKSIH